MIKDEMEECYLFLVAKNPVNINTIIKGPKNNTAASKELHPHTSTTPLKPA